MTNDPFPGWPERLAWLNTRGPVDLRGDLEGHVIVLCFWTASCVHSRQALRALARIEHVFFDRPVVVVGVHSGRFAHERDVDSVAAAVERWDVRFPVAVDDELEAWTMWQPRGWPYLGVIDPSGEVAYRGLGEPKPRRLEQSVRRLLDDGDAHGTLAQEPFRAARRPWRPSTATGLRFPTRVTFDEPRGLLWIADTGHHRVLGVEATTGRVAHVVGCGLPGFGDGSGPDAALCAPEGVALLGGTLWIADTGNHSLRTFDPDAGLLETVMGTGRRERDTLGGYCGRDQGLNGPCALVRWEDPARGQALLVAMGGGQQLWVVDADTMVATAAVGTGGFGTLDDRDDHASLSQPSDLAAHGTEALWVDAASGRLRLYDGAARETRRVVGGEDGDAADRLLEPIGVAWGGLDHAFVADAGAGRILRVDLDACHPAEFGGPELVRPEGLTLGAGRLWAVDAYGHRIWSIDPETGDGEPLTLRDAPASSSSSEEVAVRGRWLADAKVTLRLHLDLPPGSRVDSDARVAVVVEDLGGDGLLERTERVAGAVGSTVAVPIEVGQGRGEVFVEASYIARGDGEGVWHRRVQRWIVAVELAADGQAAQDLRAR